MKIGVVGGGSWGYEVKSWCYGETQLINAKHENTMYLPDIELPKNLEG